jgi:hypothetical protein
MKTKVQIVMTYEVEEIWFSFEDNLWVSHDKKMSFAQFQLTNIIQVIDTEEKWNKQKESMLKMYKSNF